MNQRRRSWIKSPLTNKSRATTFSPLLLTGLSISDLKHDSVYQEYTFVDPLPDKYLCGICKSVLSEPHVTECCGQHFCKECIEKSKTESKACPNCRKDYFNHMIYLPIKREINDLKVICPRRFRGCKVQLDYADKKKHDKECEYALVPCTNMCEVKIIKRDLESHLQYCCQLREATCPTCGKVGKFKDVGAFTHYYECPNVIQHCQNYCGMQFKRRYAESHNSICPEATVTCDFAEAGCQATLKRKDLDSHMETDMKQHLSLLMTAHIAIKEENAILKEENAILKEENAILKEENAALKQENPASKQENTAIKQDFKGFNFKPKETFKESKQEHKTVPTFTRKVLGKRRTG